MEKSATTYQEEHGEVVCAGLACAAARPVRPSTMSTLVIDAKVLHLSSNQVLKHGRRRCRCATGRRKLTPSSVLGCFNQPVLVPLGASAVLPRFSAQVAELLPAAARHVVASMCKLDELMARRAALPAFSLAHSQNLLVLLVIAREETMGSTLAPRARPRSALRARGDRDDVGGRTEELRASRNMAVDSTDCAELKCLLVEAGHDCPTDCSSHGVDHEGDVAASRREE
jgi:hypothetical protein